MIFIAFKKKESFLKSRVNSVSLNRLYFESFYKNAQL